MPGIDDWMETLKKQLLMVFGERLIYMGLQGSFRRGEATGRSDIDVMVVLDCLDINDLKKYKKIISAMDMSERACGFICGKEDIFHWPKYELFHLLNETKDYYGTLNDLVPAVSRDNIKDFVHINAANLYHELCHRFLYSSQENNVAKLYGLYKITFYIMQNLYYLNSNEFAHTKAELVKKLNGADKEILETLMNWDNLADDTSSRFDNYFSLLLSWCSRLIQSV